MGRILYNFHIGKNLRDVWVEGWVDGWKDGWMDGWMDDQTRGWNVVHDLVICSSAGYKISKASSCGGRNMLYE